MLILKKTKLVIISFILLFTFIINNQIKAQCHIDDWTALKALYENTGGDNWINNTGWPAVMDNNTEPANCNLNELFGIYVGLQGRVEGIYLGNNQLTGSIPAEFGKLNKLVELFLGENQLSGSIPAELNGLINLSILNLGGNKLSGSIPSQLGNLSNLTDLNLEGNQLGGNITPELANLTRLTHLNLSFNKFSGSIAPELANLNKLSHLWLSYNQFNGSIPAELGNLSNLEYLNLNSNQLTSNIPAELSNLNNLEWLILDNNQLTGSIIPELGNLSKLTTLRLGNNQLSGSIPAQLGNLSNLLNLNLEGNKLSGSIVAELAGLSKLIELNLSFNQLSGSIPNELGALSNLTHLWLGDNQLSGSIPPQLSNLSKLVYLWLHNNQLSGAIPTQLSSLSNLTYLWFGNNQLSGSIPPQMGNLNQLRELFLGDNQLSGSIPPELGNLSNVSILNLEGNNLNGSIPAQLGNLSNLESLMLSYNQLNGSLPSELGNLGKLTDLKLSYNQFSGSIPAALGSLDKLTYLLLNNNQLSGNISTKLSNLNKLTNLNLAHNKLSGNIPIELSNLIHLDLAYNQFSGSIPAELSNLTYLNLSYNQFSGIIPAQLVNLKYLTIDNNYFSCTDIQTNFQQFNQLEKFNYLPQYFEQENYEMIKSKVFDTLLTEQKLSIEIDFPFDTTGIKYQWFQNGNLLPKATKATLNLGTIQLHEVGKYTLKIDSENCLPEENAFEVISNPVYVILKGYDLFGQPVQYDQIMVEFDNAEETKQYEDEFLYDNGGFKKKACNCNRELYLWQFPNTDNAVAALIAIDEKLRRIKRRNKLRGGFNNNLSIEETASKQIAYKVMSDAFKHSYPDSVSVFILDTGLDETNYNARPFLYNEAAIDSCYDMRSSGYSYIGNTVTTNYSDEVWHGTFGFRSITDSLNYNTKLKLVPLKIFNKNGEGNLFDMVCALYHAINHNADIINISAGYQGEPSEILENAINLAREKGVFITAAAGNDTLNIDTLPQYPAYYAGQYYKFFKTNIVGDAVLDSVKLNNVISVASIDKTGKLSPFSNYGKQSVTLACYGDNIHSYGLEGTDIVASGTSMATYFATKALALEIAKNNSRDYQTIWNDFETSWLAGNPLLLDKTQTGKQIKFELEPAKIEGCMDITNCNYYPFATINDTYFCLPSFINANEDSSKFLHANDSIVSNKVLAAIDTVTYKAGDLIILKNGFEVKKEATFDAEIGCDE